MRSNAIKLFLMGPLVGLMLSMAGPHLHAQTPSPVARAIIEPQDLGDWRFAELSDTKEAYQAYLSVHPQGWFTPVAASRIQAGLTIALDQLPYMDYANPTPEQTRAMSAWDERMWQDAQIAGTNVAMRDYLIHVRGGVHRSQAAQAYMATLPRLPPGLAPDCSPEDASLQVVTDFNVERAYPARSIARGLEEHVIGNVLVDHTGLSLAWIDPLHTQPSDFAASTQRAALAMRFARFKAGCLPGTPLKTMAIRFALDNANNTRADRPIAIAPDATLPLDEKTIVQVPEGRAVQISIPHNGAHSVYSVVTTARFEQELAYSRDGNVWRPLLNGTHVVASGPEPVFLRIATDPILVMSESKGSWIEPAPSGPVEIKVTRQATRAMTPIAASSQHAR